MKKYSITVKTIFAITLLSLSNLYGISFDDYKTHVSKVYLDPFAKDLGIVLGGGTFSGSNCGFPGLDVSVKFIIVSAPSADDLILPQNTLFFLPYAQVEVGLPFSTNLMARGFMYSNFTVLGFGIKYKFVEETVAIPGISIFVTYNFITGYADFDANTLSFNGSISKGFSPLPVSVYATGGVDFTNINTKIAGFTDIKGAATGYRVNTGVRFSPFPLVYINADIGILSPTSYNLGLGISF